jgi:hypothetical protein
MKSNHQIIYIQRSNQFKRYLICKTIFDNFKPALTKKIQILKLKFLRRTNNYQVKNHKSKKY